MVERRTRLNGSARKWALLAMCGLCFCVIVMSIVGVTGLGGRPWYGWWDGFVVPTDQQYVLRAFQLDPEGAAYAAGLRDGDTIDLREQRPNAWIQIVYQPSAIAPIELRVLRGSRAQTVRFVGGTLWDGTTPLLNLTAFLALWIAWICFVGCATIITTNRWNSRNAILLVLVFLFYQTAAALSPTNFVPPNYGWELFCLAFAGSAYVASFALFVSLTSRFGKQTIVRRVVESLAYAAIAALLVCHLLAVFGMFSFTFDPLPYTIYGTLWSLLDNVVYALLLIAVAIAVWSTPASERPRTAWLLLPFPATNAIGELLGLLTTSGITQSWYAGSLVLTTSAASYVLGAVMVTYALLKRRVLDFEFVLSRTVTLALVSTIIVASFVILEFVLGTALAGASHATGLVANGALALVLGLSLRYVHKGVDRFVDRAFFKKRHDDERALRDFSKEAAFVTNSDALLDQTIVRLQRHTDARSAAVLLNGTDKYVTARGFGDNAAIEVEENDAAILALKTWHKSFDPHHYTTQLPGALALPMLARGRLFGVLVMGERAGGEAYAPDEVEALSQLAHGVGLALEGLAVPANDPVQALGKTFDDAIGKLGKKIDELSQKIERGKETHAET